MRTQKKNIQLNMNNKSWWNLHWNGRKMQTNRKQPAKISNCI